MKNERGDDVKTIFDATELNNLKLKNRLFRSATWDGLVNADGTLPDEVYAIHQELAQGGFGVIITGLTDVSGSDHALEGNMRLHDDELIPDYKQLTDLVHQYDCKIITQINLHRFKKKDTNGKLVEVAVNDLSEEDIQDVIRLFTDAAIRAKKSGFDGVQIHIAYGWLLNRFINPNFNHRIDKYGGSAKNRARIHVEILNSIRDAVPDIHITTKIG